MDNATSGRRMARRSRKRLKIERGLKNPKVPINQKNVRKGDRRVKIKNGRNLLKSVPRGKEYIRQRQRQKQKVDIACDKE